jgi:hypothetical protein
LSSASSTITILFFMLPPQIRRWVLHPERGAASMKES